MSDTVPIREEILTDLAHELRNPLASIMSSIELIQAIGQHSDDVPRLLEIVNKKVRTMATVIDNLFVTSSNPSVNKKADALLSSESPAVEHAALRILVVDDNATAADSLVQILRLRDYEAEAAYGGAEGFEKARFFLPQVAILDIGMPDIDGYALARMIHIEDSSCTLIALTGYGQVSDKVAAFDAGFAYHVTKPTSIKDIESILQTVAATIT